MNRPVRIYISGNHGLPNFTRSLSILLKRLDSSGLPTNNLQIICSDPSEYEYPALHRLWMDSHSEDFHGLYLHCKGSSKTDETEFQNGIAWMHYMADGVIDRHEDCRKHLSQGADLVGAMWYRHFKGNFFWFNSSYVRKLADPCYLNNGTRFAAEYWCSQAYWQNQSAPRPKVKNLFYIPIKSDSDFLHLRVQDVKPDFSSNLVCCGFSNLEPSNDYTIYNEFQGTSDDYRTYGRILDGYANYDSRYFAGSTIVMPTTREQAMQSIIGNMTRGAEIGVQCGVFSRCLLQSFKGHLVLVDAWRSFSSAEYRDGANVSDINQLLNMATTVEQVQDYPGRYDIVRDLSVNAANRYPNEHFDFVYLDGNHSHPFVVNDLKAWVPKVRKGGILCGHDYADGEYPEGSFGVKRAVNEHFGRPPDMITNEQWPTFFYKL